MVFSKKVTAFFATGFGTGYLPFVPGTWGTLVGIPVAFLFSQFGNAGYLIAAVIFILFSIYVAGQYTKNTKNKDPKEVVIDEIAGFVVAMFLVPFTIQNVLFVFVVFRVLDMLKPWPIEVIDENMKGGKGIVLDDVAAGIIANIVFWGLTTVVMNVF